MKKAIISVAALLALTACGVKDAEKDKNPVRDFPPSGEVTLTASWGGADPATRTVRRSDGKVWWSANEAITVFACKEGSVEFTSVNTAPSATASFVGTIPVDDYNEKAGGKGKNKGFVLFPELVAVYPTSDSYYPFMNDVNYDGDTPVSYEIAHDLPGTQTAVAGTFDNNLFVSVAASSTTNLTFHHVTGGLKFSVSGSDIYRVELTSNDSYAYITGLGHVLIDPAGTVLGITKWDYSSFNYATLQTSSGNLVPGQYYYFVTWPALLNGGFTLKFYTASGTKERVITQNLEFKSGRFLVLNDADADLNNTGGVSGGLDDITYDPIN